MPRPFAEGVLSFWTRDRLRFFCTAVVFLLSAHILWVYFADTARSSMLKRGDFPSFYSAAMLVRQGLADKLYDTQALRYVQNLYWPSLHNGYISYPYPQYVAAALVPLAYVPPLAAKWLLAILMIICLVFTVRFTSRFAPVFRDKLGAATFLLAFFPVSFSVFGGQNSALSMLCYSALLYFLSKQTRAGDFAAGIALGFWMFKPQYGAAVLALFLLAGFWRPAASACIVMLIQFALAAKVSGWLWFFEWAAAARRDALLDFPFNSFNMVSIPGFFHALGRMTGGGKIFDLAGGLLAILLLVRTGIVFGKLRSFDEAPKRQRIFVLLLLTAPVLLLASPHALFYDMGICVIACAPFVRLGSDRAVWSLIALTFAASLASAFKAFLPFQPLVFLVAGSLLFVFRRIPKGLNDTNDSF